MADKTFNKRQAFFARLFLTRAVCSIFDMPTLAQTSRSRSC